MSMVNHDYPLVTESGETFLTSQQLARFIRERCGDEVGRFIENILAQRDAHGNIQENLRRIMDLLCDIDISDVERNINLAIETAEKVIV